MRIAPFVALAALAVAATDTSAAPTTAKRANYHASTKNAQAPKQHSSTSFRVANWVSLNNQSLPKPIIEARLNIDVVNDDIEQITVYGKRMKRAEQGSTDDKSAILLGPATVTGTTNSDQTNFNGLKVTAAIPVGGIPGLDVVMNVLGGHDRVNASTTVSSASATVGLRLKF